MSTLKNGVLSIKMHANSSLSEKFPPEVKIDNVEKVKKLNLGTAPCSIALYGFGGSRVMSDASVVVSLEIDDAKVYVVKEGPDHNA
ncbi:hypothetical protein FQR65_LT09540 [Abscondita terminalis]|nr:hypothetical protein FQR65_LT09540 [Abscondita terminalis]